MATTPSNNSDRELNGEAAALQNELNRNLAGDVRFDSGHRAMYAQDASNYRQVPIGVVMPRTGEEVERCVEICRSHEAPLLLRGAGTSLAGQGCNVAVVLDTSRYLNRILEIDPDRRTARVEPGVILDSLRSEAERYGLTFGPDPATHAACTIGGMIGNNACGVHSLIAGRTSDNVEEMEVLTYDGHRMRVGPLNETMLEAKMADRGRAGEIYQGLKRLRDDYADVIRQRYPKIPRRVSGYNLDELLPENGLHVARSLVGTEGTCAVVLEATLKLIQSPPFRTLVVLGFADVPAAADWVPEVLTYRPIGLEGMDHFLVDNMRAKGVEKEGLKWLPSGRGWLFVEFGGATKEDANGQAQNLIDHLAHRSDGPWAVRIDDPRQARLVWETRESGLGYSARLADGKETCEGWEDAAVSPEKLGDYIRAFRSLITKYGYRSTFYGHFGQGLVHNRIDFDLASREGIRQYRAFVEEAARLVVAHGGSLSGEHGDGQSRAELLPTMFGSELVRAFKQFKTLWDPQAKMNPGKVVDPFRLDENLRLGPDYRLPELQTNFQFPEDDHNFARATGRCIGVGKCRRLDSGTMCPSYMVTQEERHTTRGRARLLSQMAEGRLEGGWRNEQVREALDLCLGCKGCKGDCPASVDVATYKAEFLSHYYEGRPLPREAYAFGWIHRWARVASLWPAMANCFTHAPGLSWLAKQIAGIAHERTIPSFASTPFRHWFFNRHAASGHAAYENGQQRGPVLLWPDTFNNYFRPEILQAAVHVLEAAGFEVIVPDTPLCCGRPLYDFGMLRLARQLLNKVLNRLHPHIEREIPLVAVEPSCAAVFRDELTNLLPNHPDAKRLRYSTFTLAEFLSQMPHDLTFSTMAMAANTPLDGLFHPHCHQAAVMGTSHEIALLQTMGFRLHQPDSGCCGMAGSFGFKKKHYSISKQIGERVLLPAVRETDTNAFVITDGFSCAEQIRQETGRRPHHLAEIIAQRL